MPRPASSLPVAVGALLALASPAAAGPLAEVAHGIDNKVETHQDRGPSSPPPSDPTPDPSPPQSNPSYDTYHDPYTHRVYTYDPTCTSCEVAYLPGGEVESETTFLSGPGRLDLYLGAHSVVGSQGAVVGEVRASKSWLGISASSTSYFEQVDGKRGEDTVRLDLMAFALNGRVLDLGATELWIDGGLAASNSSEYDTILGTAFGLRAEHQVSPNLNLVAQGRFFAMEYDVSATEAWAGVRAWFLSAGYRVLRFNVGPALHGPEAGLAFRF